jgi:hypothetical protein
MKTLTTILLALTLSACTQITQPATTPTSIIGQWNSSYNEYQLAVVRSDSAYMFEQFDGYGAPDSSISLSEDSLFVSFVFPGVTTYYRLRVYADSLYGTVSFGNTSLNPISLIRVK